MPKIEFGLGVCLSNSMRSNLWRRVLFISVLGLGLPLSAAEPRNLSSLKAEILAYVDTGAYVSDLKAAVAPAQTYINERVARRRSDERLAVVLDIDETALSNVAHMRAFDFGYVPAEWDAWVARGEAPALAPVRALFQTTRALGVAVIFITGRRERDRPGTEKNLRAKGFGDYAALWFMPDSAPITTEQFKTATRKKIQAAGYVIIANVGDQASDLAGGYAERTFKLPAPFYLTP